MDAHPLAMPAAGDVAPTGVLMTSAEYAALIRELESLRSSHRTELARRLHDVRAHGVTSDDDDRLAVLEESAVDRVGATGTTQHTLFDVDDLQEITYISRYHASFSCEGEPTRTCDFGTMLHLANGQLQFARFEGAARPNRRPWSPGRLGFVGARGERPRQVSVGWCGRRWRCRR